jgi:creatinine amidohydrolase/Fe(II)-dependent formamide hydrolase-like protein
MRYELMRPHQIRQAIAANTAVVLPLGVLEYHGEHLPSGMDTLAVTHVLDRLEAEMDLVILPPFTYGAASYAVAPPEGTGTLHLDAGAFQPFAEALFTGLLRIGFRNITGLIHHQTENFAAGMPTDLAFRFAEGWWGSAALADYYASHDAGTDPFNWIRIEPLMTPEITARYPFDHAGVGETSLMLALAPETVDMARLPENTGWYTASAAQASADLGEKGVALILDRLRGLLAPSSKSD